MYRFEKDISFEDACQHVLDHKLFAHNTAEEIVKFAREYADENTEKEGMSMLMMQMGDYAITEEIQVGELTVGVIGHECQGTHAYQKDPRLRGKYNIYKGKPEHWVKESNYAAREDILKIAQVCADIDMNKCEEVTVEFPTGDLCISNFFCEDRDHGFDELPKDMKYKEEFSINNSFGRRNTMKWLAENRGIAYGQLGNTSCHVYKVSDDKLVVIGNDEYYIDDEGYEQEMTMPIEWEKVGDICCDVWRFEAVDKQRFVEHDFDLEAYKAEKTHKEFLDVTVNAGEWDMKCYYKYMSDDEMVKKFGHIVYAELERKV
jgi:hypothetical protein